MNRQWKPIEKLNKNKYQFVLIYDEDADIVRLMLWNPSTKMWEDPPPEQGNVTHFMHIPETKKNKTSIL